MPPRFAYWTILVDGQPTAFRARDQQELLPTLNQLKRTNKDVLLRWFARGRLWESQQQDWEARRQRKTPMEGREEVLYFFASFAASAFNRDVLPLTPYLRSLFQAEKAHHAVHETGLLARRGVDFLQHIEAFPHRSHDRNAETFRRRWKVLLI